MPALRAPRSRAAAPAAAGRATRARGAPRPPRVGLKAVAATVTRSSLSSPPHGRRTITRSRSRGEGRRGLRPSSRQARAGPPARRRPAGRRWSASSEARGGTWSRSPEAEPRAAGGPVEIRVGAGPDPQLLAACGDDVEAGDAPAGGSPGARIPAEPACEQVAAETDARAVSDRERQSQRDEASASSLWVAPGSIRATRASGSSSSRSRPPRSRSSPPFRSDAPSQL